jgi:hypothetical protein
MAITATLSQAELQRVASRAYEGLPIRVSLANEAVETLTVNSAVSSWDALQLSGNGYATYRTVIGTGSYDVGDNRYEMPFIDAEFSATGAGYSYNKIYIVLGSFTTSNLQTVAVSSNVATFTTTSAHGLTNGDIVYIDTTTASGFEGYKTATVVNSTTFTINVVTPDAASTSISGTCNKLTESVSLHSLLTETPTKNLAAGQTQTYRILLATDD